MIKNYMKDLICKKIKKLLKFYIFYSYFFSKLLYKIWEED